MSKGTGILGKREQKFYEDPGNYYLLWSQRGSFGGKFSEPCDLPETSSVLRAPELHKGHWLLIAALSAVMGFVNEEGGALVLPGCRGVAFTGSDSPLLNTQPPVCLDLIGQ